MHDLTDTLDWEHICFIDCETRTLSPSEIDGNVTKTTTLRYAQSAYPILITWSFGLDGEVHRWENPNIMSPPNVDELPDELLAWDGYYAAWNSGFDRAILDPYLCAGVDAWIDMMAHAAYNNLPLSLDRAARACGLEGKVVAGKMLIKMFCTHDGDTPESHPKEWADFCKYADVDVEQMQAVAAATFPVPYSIWREFWASERINDRGLPIDLEMAKGGKLLADAYTERLGEVMSDISDGEITGPKQFVRQRAWVWERIKHNPFVAQHMVEAEREGDDGEMEHVLKMNRPAITKMIGALLTQDEDTGLTDDEYAVLQLLEEREYGASSAPAKFSKMLDGHVDGYLPNQYVFSGATQTGRFSSRFVQVHNMTNRPLGDIELEERLAVDMQDQIDLDTFEEIAGNPGKALSLMIRPAIAAPPGQRLVWGDWSNVEARGLPWLAKAEKRLDIFRAIDADPANTPDVYLQAAAGMYGHDPRDLLQGHKDGDKEVKGLRQKGKIAELALGFSGGPGALQSMAANYGMAFADDEAQDIVDRWRAANPWAVDFWDKVWDAFISAVKNPGKIYTAGLVGYEGILVGDQTWVVCYMPDNRPLFYRNVKERTHTEYDPFEPDVVLSKKQKLSFEGEDGIKYLWRGILVENVTQGICASLLREALVTLDHPQYSAAPVIAHTHDEIVLMTEDDPEFVQAARGYLKSAMLQNTGWNQGLPLGVDLTDWTWYSKALDD